MSPLPLHNPDAKGGRGGSGSGGRTGLCHFLNLQEDNMRFVLLAVLLYFYLAVGACIFQAVEETGEDKMRRDFQTLYDDFIRNFSNCYHPNPLSPSGPDPDKDWDRRLRFVGVVDEEGPSNRTTTLPPRSERLVLVDEEDVEMVDMDSASVEHFRVTLDGLHDLLFAYGNATHAGLVWKRKRWDWAGSFHFAWTIVSTIGYGATTPTTTLGKLLLIPYGFFGCAGGLLFFNLFLERIITFLATCMRTYRLQRQKRRPCVDSAWGPHPPQGRSDLTTVPMTTISPPPTPAIAVSPSPPTTGVAVGVGRGISPSRSSLGEESVAEGEVVDWKPSVYWVMLCLFVMSVLVISTSGVLFQAMEGWTFGEAIYFSFVSYATIGLGDYVSLQQPSYGDAEGLYRALAFTLMVFGCCCIYSLLNVTSIVIKQLLNLIIKKMDGCGVACCCCTYCSYSAAKLRRRMSSKKRGSGSSGHHRHDHSHSRSMRGHRSVRNGGGKHHPRPQCQISTVHKNGPYSVPPRPSSGTPGSPDFDVNSDSGTLGPGGFGGSRFDLDERRCSGENMISLRGELNNKVSLAVMQKRLYETAQMSRHSNFETSNNSHSHHHASHHHHHHHPGNSSSGLMSSTSFSASSVGPLAIVTEKLGTGEHST